jgi:hypothetical protein
MMTRQGSHKSVGGTDATATADGFAGAVTTSGTRDITCTEHPGIVD